MAYQIRMQVGDNQRNLLVNQFRFYGIDMFSSKKPVLFQESYCKNGYGNQGNQGRQGGIYGGNGGKNDKNQHGKKSFLKVSLSLTP